MKNIEKIKQMNSDELAEFLEEVKRQWTCIECCSNVISCDGFDDMYDCKQGIKHWLEQESEE